MKQVRQLIAFSLSAAAIWMLGSPSEALAEKEKEILKTKAIRAIVTPDGKSVAAASLDNVRLIDPAAKKSTVFRKSYAQPVLSPDGKALALVKAFDTEKTDSVEMIDLATKKPTGQFTIPSAGHVASAVAPEGKTFAYGNAKDILLLDSKTGKEGATAKALGGQPWCLSFSADGKQLACGFDEKKVMLFDVDGLKPGHTVAMPDWVQFVAYTADGKQLAAGAGDKVSLVDVATGKVADTLSVTKGKIARGGAFGADGKVLATGCSDGTVTIWDVATKKPLDTIKLPADVFFLSLSTDAKVLTVSLEGDISHVYDVSAATGGK
jgi:WD40 repeat protein